MKTKVVKEEGYSPWNKPLTILAGACLILGVLVFYGRTLGLLITELVQSEDNSFGLLLPLVAGYIVYLKWPRLKALPWRPSWFGLVIVAVSLALFVIGELAADLYIPRFSFVLLLTGLLYLMGGFQVVRLLLFPLLLLVAMLPLPELVTYKLTLPLQLISSILATGTLNFFGIPVHRQGNIIDLGDRQLQVVHACSGLRYILALMALGVIFTYFYQRRPWKVVVLLLSLIPGAIVANAVRVAAMGVFPSLQFGFWHTFSGWLIFLFCFALLAVLNWLMNLIQPEAAAAAKAQATAAPTQDEALRTNRLSLTHLAVALAFVFLTLPLAQKARYAERVPLLRDMEQFPLEIGPWQGKPTFIDPEMIKATRSQAHFAGEYVNPAKGMLSLWMAYYETQKKAGGFVHSPKGCLSASGWRIQRSGIVEMAPGYPVNYLLAEQMDKYILVYYWYLQRGRWMTSEYLNKFFMAWDGLMMRRTDGALIRLVIPTGTKSQEINEAMSKLNDFGGHLTPILPRFIPGAPQ